MATRPVFSASITSGLSGRVVLPKLTLGGWFLRNELLCANFFGVRDER